MTDRNIIIELSTWNSGRHCWRASSTSVKIFLADIFLNTKTEGLDELDGNDGFDGTDRIDRIDRLIGLDRLRLGRLTRRTD